MQVNLRTNRDGILIASLIMMCKKTVKSSLARLQTILKASIAQVLNATSIPLCLDLFIYLFIFVAFIFQFLTALLGFIFCSLQKWHPDSHWIQIWKDMHSHEEKDKEKELHCLKACWLNIKPYFGSRKTPLPPLTPSSSVCVPFSDCLLCPTAIYGLFLSSWRLMTIGQAQTNLLSFKEMP